MFSVIVLFTCCQGRPKINGDNRHESDINDRLIGIWNNGYDSASFIVKSDSLYDYEHFKWTKYTRIGDTATFYYLPDEAFKTKLYKIHDDTLVHELGISKTKYWRLESKSDNGL